MTKMLYEYSPQTGEFIAANPATPDPKHPGQYLARMNTTFTAPPATGEHEAAVWKNGQWETTPDWRGTTYYTLDKNGQVQQVEIKELGQTVPEGAYLNREDIPETPEQLLAAAIAKRDAMLAATDWYAVRASEPGGKPIPPEVLAYRAALREIDQQPGWPTNQNWPELPVSLAN
ncbi:MAG: phage tail assembly chaperone [Lachnospiraceae bacterium]|nr:phage tail assembly chaperone [Lachnospiraceae bacterium]